VSKSATLALARPERRVRAAADDEAEISVVGYRELLPEGLWLEAKLTHHETSFVFRAPKVFLHFEVVEPGDHFGKRLMRPFRAKSLVKPFGHNGRFTLHARSDLLLLIVRLLDVKTRPDRVSLLDLRRMLLKVQCRTVHRNHDGLTTPESMRYSVIGQIDRVD
jgi:hypothetical protein